MSNSNYIDAYGIHIQDYNSIVADLVNGTGTVSGLKTIYGSDINVASNSPDGQLVNIFALSKQDILDLIVQDYNSKDPDQAVGTALDAVSQLCGIQRKGGTYTQVNVAITANATVTLYGLNATSVTPFTVADSAGNQFALINSQTFNSGTTNAAFQASQIGYLDVLVNSITVPVSIMPGVVSFTNLAVPTVYGTDQETDAALRIRRQRSVSIPAQGFLGSLNGALWNISGLVEAVVYENTTNTTDGKGVTPHSIWVIVDGGADADIAETIYRYRNAGCGMVGNQTVNVAQADGTTFGIQFDRAVTQPVYIQLSITAIGGGAYDPTALKAALVSGLSFGIHSPADTAVIVSFIKAYNALLVPTNTQVSTNNSTWYADDVYPSTYNAKFTLNSASITIV